MSTIENHLFENESEISYAFMLLSDLKHTTLVLIAKHILTCLFLSKTILPPKYDGAVNFAIVLREES